MAPATRELHILCLDYQRERRERNGPAAGASKVTTVRVVTIVEENSGAVKPDPIFFVESQGAVHAQRLAIVAACQIANQAIRDINIEKEKGPTPKSSSESGEQDTPIVTYQVGVQDTRSVDVIKRARDSNGPVDHDRLWDVGQWLNDQDMVFFDTLGELERRLHSLGGAITWQLVLEPQVHGIIRRLPAAPTTRTAKDREEALVFYKPFPKMARVLQLSSPDLTANITDLRLKPLPPVAVPVSDTKVEEGTAPTLASEYREMKEHVEMQMEELERQEALLKGDKLNSNLEKRVVELRSNVIESQSILRTLEDELFPSVAVPSSPVLPTPTRPSQEVKETAPLTTVPSHSVQPAPTSLSDNNEPDVAGVVDSIKEVAPSGGDECAASEEPRELGVSDALDVLPQKRAALTTPEGAEPNQPKKAKLNSDAGPSSPKLSNASIVDGNGTFPSLDLGTPCKPTTDDNCHVTDVVGTSHDNGSGGTLAKDADIPDKAE